MSGIPLQVSSGIGMVSGVSTVNATPVNLYGAASGAQYSGLHIITDFSGALNVNISGGSITTSVSGNIVLVTSGGTVQVSGNVNVVSGGGPIAVASGGILPAQLVSGEVHVMSGIIGVASGTIFVASGNIGANVSGGVQVSGTVGVSGIVQIGSGSVAVVSGSITINSGNIQVLSGAVQVYTSGIASLVGAVSGGTQLAGESAANPNLRVGIYNAASEAIVQTDLQDNIAGQISLFTRASLAIQNPSTQSQMVRSVTGSSGAFVGVLATGPALWKYTEVTAAGITNIYQSGAVALHAVNINDYGSGASFRVRDAQSGITGTIVGNVAPFIGGLAVTDINPITLLYDALLTSGLVIDTSGPSWDLTVLWRNLTS